MKDIALKAIRRAIGTLIAFGLVFAGLAVVLAFVAYKIAGGGGNGAVAAALALAVGVFATGFGAIKRALARGAHAALTEAALGEKLVAKVFARIPKTGRTLPASAAAAQVEAATAAVAAEPAEGGWFARRIKRVILDKLRGVLLAQVRRFGGPDVDLTQLRDTLGAKLDGLVLDRLQDMIHMGTIVALGIALAGLAPAILLRLAG